MVRPSYDDLLEEVNLKDKKIERAIGALEKAFYELNSIRARDGVPYTHLGWKSSVDEEYFSSVVDECNGVLELLKSKDNTKMVVYGADNT